MNRILPAAIAMLLLTSGRAVAEPGNAARGERMYRACVACHSLEPNRSMTGPSLAEIWNRKAGALASFPRYSPALKSAGIVWTDDTLDEWIKDPQHFIPGNTMTFPGIKDARQRADLLAFLKEATQPGGAPKTAQGGDQMGGMMMGGGTVPNLKKLDPQERVRSITHCGDTYKVATADGKSAAGRKRRAEPAALRIRRSHQSQDQPGRGTRKTGLLIANEPVQVNPTVNIAGCHFLDNQWLWPEKYGTLRSVRPNDAA
jgi:cytochrome c